jgi:hypothetical protein
MFMTTTTGTGVCQDVTPCSLVVKGKAVPLQALAGPEGSRRVRIPDFLRQSTQEGGKDVSPTHRPSLPPGNNPGTHFC